VAIRKTLASDWNGPSVYDDAIDWTRSPRLEYIEERDASVLHYYEGERPTMWTLRALTQSQVASAQEAREPNNYMYAFYAACKGVDGPGSEDFVFLNGADPKHKRLTEDALEAVPSKVWAELGKLALDRAGVSSGESLRSGLPRGSAPIPTRRRGTSAPDAGSSGA
jgi:hypothetical protein